MRKMILCLVVGGLFTIPVLSTLAKLDRWPLFQMKGVEEAHSFPALSYKSFLDKSFQTYFEKWLDYKLPVNNLNAKIFNTIYYTTFSKSYSNSNGTVIGKDGYLYEIGYVAGYVMNSPVDREAVHLLTQDLLSIQNELSSRGKKFLLVITPSKGRVLPQYIPSRYFYKNRKQPQNDVTDALIKEFRIKGVNYLDAEELLTTQPHDEDIFYIGGIHWSDWARLNTLNATLSTLNIDARFKVKQEYIAPTANAVDGDLANLLNLIRPPIQYPTLHIDFVKRKTPLGIKIALVGGSFASGMMSGFVDANMVQKLTFYYYFATSQMIYEHGLQTPRVEKNPEYLANEILSHDVIILEINPEVLYAYGDGHPKDFINALKLQFSKQEKEDGNHP